MDKSGTETEREGQKSARQSPVKTERLACTTASSLWPPLGRPPHTRVAAPDFTLTDLSGGTVSLSQVRGKVVLLDFWAVECAGCKVEIPWYVAFDKTYRDKGLALIGIDMYGESPDMVKTFMKKANMNYPVAIGNDALGERFHVEEMPLTLLIDRSGRIALSHAGIVDKTQFEKAIQELLR
jgi:peroxiredoxin